VWVSTGGVDNVQSSLAAYTLTDNVENGRIRLATAANLTGNTLGNLLYAGTGDNVIDGGAGVDTVSYSLGVTGTTGVTMSLSVATAQATGGSGSDTLVGIENLIGTAYADNLAGSVGNNVLNGSAGNDVLTGGAGQDIFRFDTLPNATTNLDTITDFTVVDDSIQLENVIFSALTATGTLAVGMFVSGAGAVAADANDFLIYNSSTGALYYDADGSGAGAAVQFATLSAGLAMTNADFLVT
jgi:Ca2+-binding RTX toxin-like protein